MKSYKDFNREFIGDSDISTLIMIGYNDKEKDGLSLRKLSFGDDCAYNAYIVNGAAEIGSHYKLVAEFSYWLKIYDDYERVKLFESDIIKVYRAGDIGCIIQLLNKESCENE